MSRETGPSHKPSPLHLMWSRSREAMGFKNTLEPDIKRTRNFLRSYYPKLAQEYSSSSQLLVSAVLNHAQLNVEKGRRTFSLLKTLEQDFKSRFACPDFCSTGTEDERVVGYFINQPIIFLWPSFSDWLLIDLALELQIGKDDIAGRMSSTVADEEYIYVGDDFCVQRQMLPTYIEDAAVKIENLLEICYNSDVGQE